MTAPDGRLAAPEADPGGAAAEFWQRLRPWLIGAIGAVIAVAIGVALRKLLFEVRYGHVMAAVEAQQRIQPDDLPRMQAKDLLIVLKALA